MNGEVISTDLYKRLIVEPAERGCNHLVIVSGYLSAGFIETLRSGGVESDIPAVIEGGRRLTAVFGMYPVEGVTETDHRSYLAAMESPGVEVQYYNPSKIHKPSVTHSKVYLWLRDGTPTEAYCGSVNATGVAFFTDEREVAVPCDPVAAWSYTEQVQTKSVVVADVTDTINRRQRQPLLNPGRPQAVLQDLGFVDLPLITTEKVRRVHEKAGLNWGQRGGRDRNQAYIPVPVEVQRSGFFPPRGVQFIMYTDDGDQFVMARRQENGKGLHTVDSNAILGSWFRRRLGLPEGAFVHLEDLDRYGRDFVRVYKLPSDDYLMDFRADPQ